MPKSNHVDERVVEMRIDNQNFESGANKTISTLEKLERALHLKGDTSGLNEMERSVKNFDASPMSSSLEKVQASFSALEIAGMKVIANLTDSIYEFTTKTIKSFTIDPVSMGWSKFGEKTTAVATLTAQGYELEKVNALMEDLNWFTDETSYNFTDMVGNIAKFTATGQDLDQSVTAMEGIALWAALSGQNATKASQAMYQLSQAMGKGALKYDDYKSIQNASMDTQEFRKQAVAAAEELGVLKQAAEGVWEVVGQNKKFDLAGLFSSDALSRTMWFNSDVMMNVFNKYSKAVGEIQRFMEDNDIDTASEAMRELEDAAKELAATAGITLDEAFQRLGYDLDEFSLKALKAGQNARTWTDVVDSVKDAVSTGWMNTFEIIFGNAEKATEFWTNLANAFYDIFAEGGNTRNDILKIAFGQKSLNTGNFDKAIDGWEKLKNKISESGHTIEEFEAACQTVFSSSDSENLSTILDRYGSIEEAFKQGAISADQFRQIMSELTGETYESAESLDASATAMGQSLGELRKVALGILRGDYKDGDERIAQLEKLGYDYELLQAMAGDLNNGWENMSDEQLMSMMESYYQAQHLSERLGAETFAEYLANQQAIADGYERPRDEIDEMYDALIGVVGVEEDIVSAEENAIDRGELFRQGILNILNAAMNIKNVFGAAFESVFGGVNERGERLGQMIEKFHALTENIGFSAEALTGLQKIVETVLRAFRNFGTVGKGALGIVGSAVWEIFELLDDVLALIGKGEFSIGAFLDTMNEHLKNLIPSAEDVKQAFTDIKDRAKAWISGIDQDKVLAFWDDLIARLKNLKNYVFTGQLFKDIKEYLPSLQGISGLTERIGNYLRDTFPEITKRFDEWKKTSNLGTFLSGMFGDILQVFSSIGGWLSSLKIDTSGLTDLFTKFANAVNTIAGGIFGDPEEIRTRIQNFFATVKTSISEQVQDMSLSDWLNVIKTGIVSYILARIAQILKSVKNATDNFGSILDSIKKMFGGAEQMFRDIGTSFKADAIKKIAIAVGILAASLIALSFVPEEKLTHVATTMLFMLGIITVFAKSIGGINKIFGGGPSITVFPRLATALIGFGMVLGAIAALLLIAKNAKPELLIGTLVGVMVLFGVMAGVVAAMSKVKFESGGAVVGSIMALALALDLLIPVVLIFAMLPTGKAAQAGLAVAGLLGALAIAADAFSGKDHDGKQMLAAAGSMMMMALALDLLIPVITVFAALGNGTFAGIAGMVISLFALGVALAALSKVAMKMGDKGAKNMLMIASALAILAVAMDLMIPATMAFGAAVVGVLAVIPWDKLGEKLGGFWGAFGKVVAAIIGAAMIAVIVDAIGIGLMLMGAGLMAAGIGAVVLSVALVPLGAAIIKFLEGIQAIKDMPFGSIIWNLTRLAIAVGVFSLALVGIVWAIKKLTGGGLLGKLVSAIGGAGTTITSKITENMPKILDIFGTLLIMVSAHLLGMIPNFVEILVDAIVTLFSSLADSMEAHRAELVQSITRMVEVAFGILKDILREIFTSDELGFVEKALVGLGMFKVGNSVLNLTGQLKNLFGAITGKGGGVSAPGGLIGQLKDLHAAISLFIEGGGLATAGPLAALAAIFAGTAISVHRTKQEFKEDAFAGLGDSATDYGTAINRLKGDIEGLREEYANLVQWGADTSMVQTALNEKESVLYNTTKELAGILGITTDELMRQIDVADGDIMQTQAMIEYTEKQAEAEARVAEQRNESARQMGEATARFNRDAIESQSAVETQVEGTTSTFENITTKANEASGEIASAFDNSTVSIETLKTKADEYGLSWDALSEKLQNYTGDLEGLKEIDLSDLKNAFYSETGEVVAGGGNGVTDNAGLFVDAMTGMGNDGLMAFLAYFGIASPSTVMAAQAAYIPAGAAEGIRQGTGVATDAMTNFASRMILAARKVFNEYGPSSGENAVIGLVNGAYSKIQLAYDAGYETGETFMKGYDDATKTQSPSREMMQRGIYAVAGLVKGINSERPDVVNTGRSIGSTLTDAVKKSLSQVALLANDDFSISPVITPVVDMTNVDRAAGLMTGTFGKASYSLSGQIGNSVSRRLEQANRVASNMQSIDSSTHSNDNYTFNIYASQGMNEEDLANAVMERMGSRFARRGVAYG